MRSRYSTRRGQRVHATTSRFRTVSQFTTRIRSHAFHSDVTCYVSAGLIWRGYSLTSDRLPRSLLRADFPSSPLFEPIPSDFAHVCIARFTAVTAGGRFVRQRQGEA